MTLKIYPMERTICISNRFIHSELSEFDHLNLSISLWNHDTEIPIDWHTAEERMELSVKFTVEGIIHDMLLDYESAYEDEGGIVISSDYKKIVEKFKEDFQEALNTLNKIHFYNYDRQNYEDEEGLKDD